MPETREVLIFLGLLFGTLFFFGISGQVFRFLFLLGCKALAVSYRLAVWWQARSKEERRRRGHEILSSYIAVLGRDPEVLGYFQSLVDSGFPPDKLERALERNTRAADAFSTRNNVREILASFEKDVRLQQLLSRQEDLLVRGEMELEKLRFKEKALSGLVDQLKKKYEL